MKRMYVLLGTFFLIVLWAASAFTQRREHNDEYYNRIQKHMQMREELHRKILDNLLNGKHDDDLFRDMDKMFDDAMKDSFGSSFQYSFGEPSVDTEWQESSQGRTLLITPRMKDQKLDISIQDETVTIKGKNEVKTPNGTSIADFSNAFSVPQDCDSKKVKMDQKNGKIVVFFPWRPAKKVAPKKDERVPLPKSESDVAI